MCTVVVFWKVHPVADLVVAQCRDELVERAATEVARWRPAGASVDIVSGRDLVAGGTWFAVGPRVVCALTNRRDGLGPRRGARSRGDLVVEAAVADDVASFEQRLAQEPGGAFGPFSLLAVDEERVAYAENAGDGGAMVAQEVAPGVHVLGNLGLDNPDDPVVRTVGTAARALLPVTDEAALVAALQELLGKHGEGWPCVHLTLEAGGQRVAYGTRSAGVLVRGAGRSTFWENPSAPHDAGAWRDRSALLGRSPR